MSFDKKQFEQRKQDHIDLALMEANQATASNQLDTVNLRHEALPDLNFDEITLDAYRLGRPVKTPLMVASMTAGHDNAAQINRNLMTACAQSHWAMGVGSQRRELEAAEPTSEWNALRADFPTVSLFANLGIAQLINAPIDNVLSLADSLNATGLIIHCNPLQECIQPEGTRNFKGCWDALARLVEASPIPIIVKETGCGFSSSTLARLDATGVAAIDVSGLGGTHWGRIEGHRADDTSMEKRASETFRHWGISTVESVCSAQALPVSCEIWGSGGVRSGLDAAKLLALGASTIALAQPMLRAALTSEEAVIKLMSCIEYELKVALFCTGSATVTSLRGKACR